MLSTVQMVCLSFFRQRNTVGFKLKILLEPLCEFQLQRVVYICRQRWKYLANAWASSNDIRRSTFLTKVPRQRGQVKRIFRRVHFPVCRLGSSLNFSLKLVTLSEKMTRKIIKINQEKLLSGFQPQRTKLVFAQLLAKPYF